MKLSKKNQLKVTGLIAVLLLAGVIFFFTYYQVDEVQVMGSSHYSEKQIKKMVLRGPMASNSVLAPLIYTKKNTKDVPFVEGYTVTRLNRHTICVSVKEKDIVGCIPYLDSYIYFDRNGTFIESSTERNEKIPDHIEFSDDGQISLLYGDITVKLGKDEYLEDKMTRVLAILPLITDKKGILHAENVNDNSKMITLEQETDETTDSSETWTGGYDEEGNYTGEGEYDENGNYVGAKPQTDLEYALSNWVGGYDEEGDYTGSGEYDANMNYVGPAPTEESMASNGDWKGGYREDGGYDGVSEYDRDGNYVGSVEDAQNSDSSDSTSEDGDSSGDGSGSDDTDTSDSEDQSYGGSDNGDYDYSDEGTDYGYSDGSDSYSDYYGDYTSDSE